MGDKNSSTSVSTVIFISLFFFFVSLCVLCENTGLLLLYTQNWVDLAKQSMHEYYLWKWRRKGIHSSSSSLAESLLPPWGWFSSPLTFPVILSLSCLTDWDVSITSHQNTGSPRPLLASWWSFISFNYRWVCSFKPTNVFHWVPTCKNTFPISPVSKHKSHMGIFPCLYQSVSNHDLAQISIFMRCWGRVGWTRRHCSQLGQKSMNTTPFPAECTSELLATCHDENLSSFIISKLNSSYQVL